MQHPPRDAAHATHDLLVIAAAADRDADVAARTAAERQTATCVDCAELLADLRSIAAGLRDLPRAVPAPRDFRIEPDQALRLRRGSGWRRLFGSLGSRPQLPSLRLIASACTSLGLAGLLFTAFLPGLLGFGSSAAGILSTVGSSVGGAFEQPTTKDNATAVPAELNGAGASPAPQPGATSNADSRGLTPTAGTAGENAPPPAAGPTTGRDLGEPAPPPWSSWPPLTVASVVLVGIGLILFGLRLAIRRLL